MQSYYRCYAFAQHCLQFGSQQWLHFLLTRANTEKCDTAADHRRFPINLKPHLSGLCLTLYDTVTSSTLMVSEETAEWIL